MTNPTKSNTIDHITQKGEKAMKTLQELASLKAALEEALTDDENGENN